LATLRMRIFRLPSAVSARDRLRDLTIKAPEVGGIVRRLCEDGL
jgi:hypothetical protein